MVKVLVLVGLGMLGLATVSAPVNAACVNYVSHTTPTSDFALHDDGTVTHMPSGLMWMRCSLGQAWDGSACTGTADSYTWQQALQAVASLNDGSGYAGHRDWRLPNKNELESIVERACSDPAVNDAVFPYTPSDWYWSSSPFARFPSGAWNVSFNGGCVIASPKTELDRVRLVRAGR